MFAIIVIIFQAVAILFIGIFARTNNTNSLTTTYSTLFSDAFTLMLAFTLMYSPFRKLSLFTLASLLIVVAISAQTNILFGTLWDSMFKGFSASFTLDVTLMVRSIFASLSVLLTVLDFVGLFNYWQIYLLIAPIMTIGYSLNSAILTYGLKVFDGGGGLCIFLYSGVCSLMIWALSIRGKIDVSRYRIKQSYINQTLSFIGVVIAFINWPKFNMAGSLVSYNNVNTTTITSVAFLQNSALANTFMGLAAAILVSILFASKDTKQDKLKYKIYIDCFINGGVVIASFQDISLDPVTCLIMSTFSTILTLIIHKYFITPSQNSSQSTFKSIMVNYAKIIYRIIFGFIGIIICSIIVAARNNKDPALLSNSYSQIAGLEMVGFIVVLVFGVIFGAITAVSINVFINIKNGQGKQIKQGDPKPIEQLCDQHFFADLHDEMHPLYYDIFQGVNKKQEQNINLADYTTRVIKESLLGARENPLRMMSITKNVETRPNPQENRLIIQKDFSKSNFKDSDVSKLKNIDKKGEEEHSEESKRQEEAMPNQGKQLRIQKSNIKLTQNQSLPRHPNQPVKRKLDFDDYGSEIKEEVVDQKLARK